MEAPCEDCSRISLPSLAFWRGRSEESSPGPPHRSAISPCPDGDNHPGDGGGAKRYGRGVALRSSSYSSAPAVPAPAPSHCGVGSVNAAWVLACEAEPRAAGMLRGRGGRRQVLAAVPLGGVAGVEGTVAYECESGPSDALASTAAVELCFSERTTPRPRSLFVFSSACCACTPLLSPFCPPRAGSGSF